MYKNKLEMETGYTFDDVLLIPAASQVEPSQADIKSRFTRNIGVTIPFVSAAMDTVTESGMAVALARLGAIGVIHRNMTPEREVEEIRKVKQAEDFIERNVVTVDIDSTVSEVDHLMNENNISGVPVIENGKVVGIVSRRDLRWIASKKGADNIRSVMTSGPITVNEDILLEDAIEVMYNNKVERLPVTSSDGRILGIMTMQDLLEKNQYPDANRDKDGNLRVSAAVGPFDFERAVMLDETGVDALVADCAHGHNLNVVKAIKDIKGSVKADVIAGNIATSAAAEAYSGEIDALKVGIGPGSICTTRVVAGVGVPQITAIASVSQVCTEYDVPVIADGGIRYSGDVAKAIAAGAECVMLGSLLAGTDESPGRIIAIKGRRYKQYRGMGSLGVMTGGQSSDRYFQKKGIGQTKFVPEGIEGATPYVGEVSDIIYQLTGGLKSSMGYTGSATVRDLREKGEFIKITSAGQVESHPHDILITDEAPNYRLPDNK
ncbi:IMP dehydrogenase [Methanoplanus endosymbiosus]|uniref:Inosine-5'-monophosphate dehydrogenase n=1 Tax=Methanoplanus endosymbiosus TaxID=33865 RepID=A0A9E7TJC4_9EURY|nr:IMP dehydrogenase [Methanoplanus endosymbiosus]UUX91709.1 IMP dehydrogenase [Methanoplanus endosymbiosus]